MYGYLKKFSSAAIRVRTDTPDSTELPDQEFDWCHSVYGHVEEVFPKDLQKQLGKSVTTITCKDASLYHDMMTGFTAARIACDQNL
jgi:hypothetical protein